jgi:hypothetical protein
VLERGVELDDEVLELEVRLELEEDILVERKRVKGIVVVAGL